jgi:Ca-activated chloride channel family protein
MRFAHSAMIYSLWFLVLLITFYFWAFRAKRRSLELFAQRDLLAKLAASSHHARQTIKAVIVMVAILCAAMALMRPQWGFHWEEIKRRGVDILVAIDTSKSMLAKDVKPNRLERSKLAVKDLVKKLKGDRIGLIAFAGNAFLQCPLTVDYNGFMLALDDVDVDTIPKGGTALTSAIREARKSYEGGQKKYKVLVLITDGEDHEGDARKAAEAAHKEGIKIFCIGIGTREGELIPIADEFGKKTFLKDRNGLVVKSQLDEATLQEIALTTGGSYVRATGAEFGLDVIYDEKISKLEKRELESKMKKHYEERFQIPLGMALLLLLIELCISDRRART